MPRQPPGTTLFPYTTLFRSFRRLTLPTPNEMREGAGTPGPRYWQQRADYTIRATLDTATHTIAGSETLRDRKSTRLNSSHTVSSYAVFCLKKKINTPTPLAL